ncbi:MAG: MraY family glycosyltransferase [Candidatus Dojkabacteria bacterium]|nr:MAG: MraY family glycosyltransferase [Candidatus Dojkabacteria bacterium]
MTIYLLAGLVAFLGAVIVTPWVGLLAKRFGAIQEPPEVTLRRIQEQREKGLPDKDYESKLQAARRRLDKPPMLLWGGIGYVLPFLVVSIGVLLTSQSINIPVADVSTYILWFSTIAILLMVGMYDDVFELTGRVQFLFHLLASLLLVLSPIDLRGINIPFGLGFLDLDVWHVTLERIPWFSLVFPGDFLLFLWVLPLINAIKWIGGSDGLMEGDMAIAMLIIFLVSFQYGQPTSALFAITLAGALFGFLVFNFFPNKIISGSTGKTVIGFIIAGISLIDTTKLAISLIVFALPLVDAFWVLLRRIIHYKPRSFIQLMLISNQYHFHFQLKKLGFSERKIAYFEYAYIAFWGLLGVYAPYQWKSLVLVLSWVVTFGMILSITARANEKGS